MVGSPQTTLKVIFVVHFVLSVWASMSGCLFGEANVSYIYVNAVILAFGFWAIICPDSLDSLIMFFVMVVISIILDMVFIGVHASQEGWICQTNQPRVVADTYRFSLGMAILNLLLKPLSGFILFRIYQDRTGLSYSSIIGSGDHSRGSGGYYGNDQPVAHSQYVETASPYSTVDKTPTMS